MVESSLPRLLQVAIKRRLKNVGAVMICLVNALRITFMKQKRRPSHIANVGRHYKQSRRQKLAGQKDLQDLLIDPQYDALFDGNDEDPQKDPFSDNPKGRSSTKRAYNTDRGRQDPDAGTSQRYGEPNTLEEEVEEGHDDVEDLSYYDLMKKYQRHYFLQEQQEEVMIHHHKMRASEVPPYAQATVLAGLLEQYDNMDEYLARHPQQRPEGNPWVNAWNMIEDPDYNLDDDPLPAWIRAKRMIAGNWDAVEELNGNRQRTIERIGAYTELTPERQHMIDTWDPKLFEGTPDEPEMDDDYMDQFLKISEATAEEEEAGPDNEGQAFVDELLSEMEALPADD